ncbi:MAG: hypothetical protein ACKVP7_05255 [Hyphomicrobiaceae bacterium]
MAGPRRQALGLGVVLVVALGAAGPPPAATPSPPVGKTEPPLKLIERIPVQTVQTFTGLQERIVQGSREAAAAQVEAARDVNRVLHSLDMAVWDDVRNRQALIKFVLSGGAPDLLKTVLERIKLAEPELKLVRGSFAFAQGHRARALEFFDTVEPRTLVPSLAGHVALVKALLLRETDIARALSACDEARLLSPGTVIEEAALRSTIDLAIAIGDRPRFETAVRRLFQRFPNSVYAMKVDAQIAHVMAAADPAARPLDPRVLDVAAVQLPPARSRMFFQDLAEASVRAGRLPMAILAAERLNQVSAGDAQLLATSRAIDGAVRIFGAERAAALRHLLDLEAADLPANIRQLIQAARELATIIEAPVDRSLMREVSSTGPAAPSSTPPPAKPTPPQAHDTTVAKATAKLAEIDKHLAEGGP